MPNIFGSRELLSNPVYAIRFVLDSVRNTVKLFSDRECGTEPGEDVEYSVVGISIDFQEVFNECMQRTNILSLSRELVPM